MQGLNNEKGHTTVQHVSRKAKVLSLPETMKEKWTFRVNIKTSRDKIKANQMDFIKTNCKQRNVDCIA